MTLSSLAGVSVLNTVNITNANAIIQGPAGINALTAFKIGNGGTLTFQNAAGVSAGTSIQFTGTTGNLVFSNGISVPVLNGITGFGPGKTIDLTGAAATSLSYADNAGTNTGGVIRLLDANNQQITTVSLNSGDFATSDFHIQSDGIGGTLIDFNAVVTAVTATPANGTLGLGQSAVFTVTTNKPVSITGAPTLLLSDGGVATYNAAQSQGSQLAFVYTVGAGENSTDLAVTGVATNGAVMVAADGSGFDLATAISNPNGALAVDTIPPTVLSVTADNPNATLGIGGSVALTVTMSEAVTVAGGTPTLTLNDGGVATYDPVASTATRLVFRHTVAAGQNASDLAVTALNLNGATIADAGGNASNLAAAVVNPAGTLAVDTIPPTISSVTTDSPNAVLSAGGSVTFAVNLNEAVTVASGTPTLTLNDGGVATYDPSASTGTRLVFRHPVVSGQNTPDLAITAVNLNGASITDAGGNAPDLTAAVVNPNGTLVIDTTAPRATIVSATASSNLLSTGGVVTLTITPGEPVIISGGPPTLTLDDGGVALFDAVNSTPTSLVFTHTVAAGNNSPDLSVTGLSLNGATAIDAAGNALILGSVVGNPNGVLTIDTAPPVVTGISTNPSSGTLVAGQTIGITVALSEALKAGGGTPTLTLSDGGVATYDPVNSTPTQLVFTHTVQPGQNVASLAVTGVSVIGAPLTDAAGNPLDLTTMIGNPVGTLAVDTTNPVATSVSTDPPTGSLGSNQTVSIIVTLNRAVTVAGGMPTLTLSDGGTALFDPTQSTATTLVFTHQVQPGQNTADLTITGASLAGATATDGTGHALNLNSLLGNPAGILAIDTTAPTVTGVTTNPGSGVIGADQIVTITAALDEPIRLLGGAPVLLLSNGGTATLDATNTNPNSLVFRYTVRPGQTASDLAIIGVNPNGAIVTDLAGNTLDLSGLIANPSGILQIDGQAPTVTSVTTNPTAGTVGAGQTVNISVAVDKALALNGTSAATLTLNDGGVAVLDTAASTPTMLVFTHLVQAGQNTADLQVIGVNAAGAPLADAAGNVLDLSAAIVNPAGILAVDTRPAVTPPPVITDPTPIGGVTTGGGPAPSNPSGNGGVTGTTPTSPPATLNVYRFFDSRNGTHFYTTSDSERDSILGSRPDLVPEGQDGIGLRAVNPASGDPDAVEVFRFFDTVHGTQFLTASTAERDSLLATRPDLKFEPEGSFFEHTQPQTNDVPVYRFFSSTDGTHFYTDSAAERATILQTRSDLIAEGIGFYEPH